MIRHFHAILDPERGNNGTLHDIFTMVGLQKRGHWLAGIRKTRGEP